MINIVELQDKIKKFGNLVEDFNGGSHNARPLWLMKSEIADYLKAVVFPTAEEKVAVLALLESHAEKLKQKLESNEVQNIGVAEEAEELIEKLKKKIEGGFYADQPNKESIHQLKISIDDIYNCFKNGSWPNKKRRSSAWDKFNEVKNSIKQEEDKYFTELREKRTEHSNQSQLIAEELIAVVHTTHPEVAIEPLIDLQAKVGAYLVKLGFTEESLNWLLSIPSDIAQKPLRAKSEALRGVKKFVIDHKEAITKEDKQRIFSELDTVSTAMDAAWEQQRLEKQKKQEEWEERKKIQAIKQQERENKQKEWEVKQQAFLKVLAEKLEKRLQDKQSIERIIQAKKEFIGRVEVRIENQQKFLKTCETDITEIEDQLQNAWSIEFRDKMVEKLAKKKAKVNNILGDMETLKKDMATATKDIEQLAIKLGFVVKSIEEIQNKQAEVSKSIEG